MTDSNLEKEVLIKQKQHWENHSQASQTCSVILQAKQ
jgi:hypothetical protein